MNKRLLIPIIILLTSKLFAQDIGKITYGLKLGLAAVNSKISYANNNPVVKSSGAVSLVGGGFLNISLSKKLIF